MRRVYIIFSILACCILGTDVNAAVARGGSARGGASTVAKSTSGGRAPVSARAATTGAAKTVSARSATTPAAPKTVAARAATTQKVVNTGTKVAAATANGTVSDACKNLYYGCMDSFCMVDNTSGGRCLCSDRNAELDVVANEIQKLDEQTYAMATSGVERIEMGEMANDVINQAKDIANSFTNTNSETKKKRQSLDLTMWTSAIDFDEDEEEKEVSLLDGKVGAGLHDAVYDMCSAQIANKNPECNAELSMLKLMYSQQIKSDCTAYENSLKQQKKSSAQKLMAAETALRDAAMEQYKSANKYDLGQCTIEFKKCMMTTAGCGDDFSACASMVALNNTNAAVKSSSKNANMSYIINREKSSIEISATTYDTLMAKKPICESVTKSCVKVGDKVWETFLADVAPQLKSAELIAEDNARQNCISSVSSCFQKACKDNIDPNDPDGSYDMCLTRPETMLNLCKVPLNACGISTDENKYKDSSIWTYIEAAMASMRVDSCTNEFKECLQSPDRCGSDYTQCIGLDFESIEDMCPTEKLVGCQEGNSAVSFDDANSDKLISLLQGIFLSVDNAMLDQCQKLVNEKMIEVCGDTTTCDAFDSDENFGVESLRMTKNSKGSTVISGIIQFGDIKITEIPDNQKPGGNSDGGVHFGQYEIDIAAYEDEISKSTGSNESKELAKASLKNVAASINRVIAALSQDPKIKMCIEGRDMKQIRGARESDTVEGRYPHLLDSMVVTIMNAGLNKARANYAEKYNELVVSAMKDADDQIKAGTCAAMAMSRDGTICTEHGLIKSKLCTKYTPAADYFENVLDVVSDNDSTNITEYVIPMVDDGRLNGVIADGAIGRDHVITDDIGTSIKQHVSAVYSKKTGVCTLTTETSMCEDKTEIKAYTYGWYYGGIRNLEGGMCKQYGQPKIETQEIRM